MNIENRISKCFSLLEEAFPQFSISQSNTNFECREYDLSVFNLKLGKYTKVFWLKKNIMSNTRVVKDAIIEGDRPVIILNKEVKLFDTIRKFSKVFVDCKLLSQSKNKAETESILINAIREQLPLHVISPYETYSFVYGDQFFGRSTEIETIINAPNRNYILFGSRRIGKTSLLQHLRTFYENEVFSEVSSTGRTGKVHFISCLGVKSLKSLQDLILSRVDPKKYWSGLFGKIRQDHDDAEVRINSYLRIVSSKFSKGVLLLLDEADALIESDDSDRILMFLRFLSENGYRVIMAGYRSIYLETQKHDSLLWNYTDSMFISQFTKDDSNILIKEPLKSMGIKIPSSVVARIYNETSGIPNYIQHYCRVIVKKASKSGARIKPDIFEEIYLDREFDHLIMKCFDQNIESPIEKLIFYYAAKFNRKLISIRDIKDFLGEHGLKNKVSTKKIRNTFLYISTMGYIQSATRDSYRISAPIILNQLRQRTLESEISENIEKIRANEYEF